MNIEIYNGDCLEIIPALHQVFKRFDFGFADPPYNVGKDYDGYDDNLDHNEYMEFTKEWLNKLTGFCESVAIYPPKTKLLDYWNLLPDQHLLICAWSPEGAIRGNYVHQYIPLLVPPKPEIRTKDHWWNVQVPGLGYFYREEKFDHPGQTSLDITQRIIRSFTKPGDWVLDPFGGVGTTAIACINLGRNCVIIGQSEKYCEIAKERIEIAQMQPKLFSETRKE